MGGAVRGREKSSRGPEVPADSTDARFQACGMAWQASIVLLKACASRLTGESECIMQNRDQDQDGFELKVEDGMEWTCCVQYSMTWYRHQRRRPTSMARGGWWVSGYREAALP